VIIEYLRPNDIEGAIKLLQRESPITLPLGGGSILSKYQANPFAVVDLQALGLNRIKIENGLIEIGATATLSEIESALKNDVFTDVIRLQAGKNQRNSGTIAGLLNVADGRSPLLMLLLAMDAQITWQPGDKQISLESWLPQRHNWCEAQLITKVTIPDVTIRFESIGRTPKDRPIVAVAIAKKPNGKLRIAIGGFGEIPTLALDSDNWADTAKAVDEAYSAAEDQWASAEYRREAGKKLAVRLVHELMDDPAVRTK
jgi:CO/xanthine dehydrogenase FAD-binding subunit